MSKRFNMRRKVARRLYWRRLVVVIALLFALAAVVWAVFFSSLLDARDVEVEGNHLLDSQTVIDQAQIPIGMPMARIDFNPMTQRLLALPEVEQVSIRRIWPHRVRIDITERTMVYQRFFEGGYQWVDAHGKVFLTRQEAVEGIQAQGANDDSLLAAVSTVVLSIPEQIRDQVESIEAKGEDHIIVHCQSDRKVNWGSADYSEQKGQLLEVMLSMDGSSIDISVPSHPAIS